jgi:hypothetical protein
MIRIVAAFAAAVALQSPASAQSYTGTWTAELSGTTYVRLELQGTNTAMTGRLSLGNMEADAKGVVIKVAAAPRELRPLQEVVRRDAHLSFILKEGRDSDRFELRLVGADSADLLFIPSEEDKKELAAEGIPAPKPIRLKKSPRAGRASVRSRAAADVRQQRGRKDPLQFWSAFDDLGRRHEVIDVEL